MLICSQVTHVAVLISEPLHRWMVVPEISHGRQQFRGKISYSNIALNSSHYFVIIWIFVRQIALFDFHGWCTKFMQNHGCLSVHAESNVCILPDDCEQIFCRWFRHRWMRLWLLKSLQDENWLIAGGRSGVKQGWSGVVCQKYRLLKRKRMKFDWVCFNVESFCLLWRRVYAANWAMRS